MKRLFLPFLLLLSYSIKAEHHILSSDIKSLQVVVNQNWISMPVMTLGSHDILNISFDNMSHIFHRYVYRLEHCEADWSPSEDLFESDWLIGFNDIPIEDYENSLNTTVSYTHYKLQIPNSQCQLKMSGNYRLHVFDEDEDNKEVLVAEFMVKEDIMNIGLDVTTNTDIGINTSYQQVYMTVNYNGLPVTWPEEQLWTVVMQNGRETTQRINVRANYIHNNGLQWKHNRDLVFDAGNEFHKYEILDVSHTTMGLDRIMWDGKNFNAYPYVDEPRRNYLYDEDADGAFYIRNSDNMENERTCDYVNVHYRFGPTRHYENAEIVVNGLWTTEAPEMYSMNYDETDQCYHTTLLQKQGYYNYQYLMRLSDGTIQSVPEEGSFFQTENRYQAFVYYKGTGDRSWRLTGYAQTIFK